MWLQDCIRHPKAHKPWPFRARRLSKEFGSKEGATRAEELGHLNGPLIIILNPKPQATVSGQENRNPKPENPEPETLNPEPEALNPKP